MNQKIMEGIAFAICIAAFSYSTAMGIRAIGFFLIITGIQWLVNGTIPYGVRNRPTSGHLTGVIVVVISLILAAIGFIFLLFPQLMLSFYQKHH